MPRRILVCPKGGSTGIIRKCYAHLHKIQLVKECLQIRVAHNLSFRGAARALVISHFLLVKWMSMLPALKVVYGKSRCSAYKGHVGQLDPVKEELLAWIFARRKQGIAVTKLRRLFHGLH